MTTGATPPIAWEVDPGQLTEVFGTTRVGVDDATVRALEATGASVTLTDASRAEASRDWWPLSLRWALEGRAPARPAAVVAPSSVGELAGVLAVANERRIPVTAAGGRSGVCGSAVPIFGGIALDCCGLSGILDVDDDSLLVDVASGTFGPDLEAELSADHGLTIGHLPQSIDLATVGGWIACRGAGQYSTRYGKIEDIVAGLEVVLADGTVLRTGAKQCAGPRSATGPDLTQVFVGSEGTLGVITSAVLRAHPVAPASAKAAYGFERFEDGLEALRLTLRRGSTPAVVRLYDERESARSFEVADTNVLIVLDEGDEAVVGAAMSVLEASCAATGATPLDSALTDRWLGHRNDVSALESVTRAGIVVDTIEVAARWSELGGLYRDAIAALSAVEGCLAASAHESHAYLDGACLYFTFAGRGEDPSDGEWASQFYRSCWDAVMAATRRHRGSLSHHHGIGIVRGPYLRDFLGEGFGVLESMKHALDPNGILNPGKFGLASPFGDAPGVPVR